MKSDCICLNRPLELFGSTETPRMRELRFTHARGSHMTSSISIISGDFGKRRRPTTPFLEESDTGEMTPNRNAMGCNYFPLMEAAVHPLHCVYVAH